MRLSSGVRVLGMSLLALGAVLAVLFAVPKPARAQEPAAAVKTEPDLSQRVADLEAYMNNVARGSDAAGSTVGTKVPGPGPGHNAWQMTSAALVLFMTLPGLALFYGGLVRRKNVLSVLAQCLGIAGLVTVLWWLCGYSMAFARGTPFLGNPFTFAFLNGVDSAPNTDYSYWISHNVFSMYQLMFAIITPALIVGAIAERMKYSAILAFVTLWMFAVYFPLAHMVWGIDGFMNGVWNAKAGIRALDFAGGTVVHMSSGWSALILCLILGKRLGFGKEPMPPHSMVLCMVGTGMLWAGWYGFNAGSALAADGIATNAFMTTTLGAAVACFVWGTAEYVLKGKATVLGFCSGAVSGLVVVTPACGFINASGAVIIGLAAGIVPFLMCYKVKAWFGYDDALDTFGVHAVGGTLGAVLAGLLATNSVNGNIADNLADVGGKLDAANAATQSGLAALVSNGLWLEQLKAIGLTLCLAIVATTVIAYVVKAVIGLRASEEVERQGLDIIEHGEEGYALDSWTGGYSPAHPEASPLSVLAETKSRVPLTVGE
ncbi:MAG: ammonium transporter [Deltaproteobacteria bacterium]|nr:ammonium transporter [Deltaproteobacteria bacterium]